MKLLSYLVTRGIMKTRSVQHVCSACLEARPELVNVRYRRLRKKWPHVNKTPAPDSQLDGIVQLDGRINAHSHTMFHLATDRSCRPMPRKKCSRRLGRGLTTHRGNMHHAKAETLSEGFYLRPFRAGQHVRTVKSAPPPVL